MTLLGRYASPLEDVWIAIDLETTGLDFDKDTIIEIGAVKFQGTEILDTFQTFVNPERNLSTFIKEFTGITQEQVNDAPTFDLILNELVAFLGNAPIIGHNVAFDVRFLEKTGMPITNPKCDTWDMVFVLHPTWPEYSLSRLSNRIGLTHDRPHRALDDAIATKELFLKLAKDASELDIYTLSAMLQLADKSPWVLSYFLRGVQSSLNVTEIVEKTDRSLDDLDIGGRLLRESPLHSDGEEEPVDVELISSLLGEDSPLVKILDGFDYRTQQQEMAMAVTESINDGGRLIAEAGTGVGKSLAYLLPAALYALKNHKRVVISTNTINLQEQLVKKDIPLVLDVIKEMGHEELGILKYGLLKGRANYLCLRRYESYRNSQNLNEDEARLLAKLAVWLKKTRSGDRTEINLGGRNTAAPWDRLSAQGATQCLSFGGPCFLRASRERAAASNLIVVNHALLLSDVMSSGTLIPDYDVLIVDEAHHLEEEATKHMGFSLTQATVEEHIQSLVGSDTSLLNTVSRLVTNSNISQGRKTSIDKVTSSGMSLMPRLRERTAAVFGSISKFVKEGTSSEFRITSGVRSGQEWTDAELLWEELDIILAELNGLLDTLEIALEGLENSDVSDYELWRLELASIGQVNADIRERLKEFIPNPSRENIYWVKLSGRNQDLSLNAAPLHIGGMLDEMLFSQKKSVVLTSATLSTDGGFGHIAERTGFSDSDELLVGSPFDYPRSALICVPSDMPDPNSADYQSALTDAIADATLAAEGHSMALFTSYASLRRTATSLRQKFAATGITVLAQGSDGSPQQIIRRFIENPRSVILGTSSFWEGVDLAGDVLKVLMVARLPFSVPTDPVFSARSELYDNAFMEYSVPQAILRLRQGFGRLIRTKQDRGVAILLDGRLSSRRYGKSFLNSLPPGTIKSCKLEELNSEIVGWLD